MAALNLSRVWVNRYDTGEALSAQSTGRARTHTVGGEVRTYAGGRQRAIFSEGEKTTFAFTLLPITLAQVETLRSWAGITVQVRDHRGQRFVGVYFDVGVDEYKDGLYSAEVTLTSVTAPDGV